MSLTETLEVLPGRTKDKCRLAIAMESRPEKDQEALNSAIARGVSRRALSAALKNEGIDVSQWAIGAHGRGECACK